MPANSSFSAIYRRGKFSRSEATDAAQDISKNQRKEDFAVAAVAFVLKHDVNFKKHFLEEVCQVEDFSNPEDYEVHLHPYDFDLVLLNNKKHEVVVLEFKMDADLDSHQKYFGEDFFRSETNPKGYGCQIEEKYCSDGKCQIRKYIVIQKSEKLEESWHAEGFLSFQGIECCSKSWLDLFPERYEDASPLGKDLWDSLACSFEVNELKSHFSMNKDLASSAKQAAEIYELIKAVADNFGEKPNKPTAYNDESGYAFGVDIKAKVNPSGGFEFLKKRQSPGGRFIWFGYEPGAGRDVSVWVCALLDKASVSGSISKRIQGADKCKIADGNKDNTSLIITRTRKHSGDREWFEYVLEMLKTLE